MDEHDKAERTGIYESPDGVGHFIKAGHPVPDDWTLREATPNLNARPEVRAAADAAENERPAATRAGGRGSSKARGGANRAPKPETKVEPAPTPPDDDDDVIEE